MQKERLQMTRNIFAIIAVCTAFAMGAIGGYQYCIHQEKPSETTQADEEWTAWDLEQAEIEMKAIYQLLAANAFTNRTNMNMSFKTNQYMKKVMEEQNIDPAIEKEASIKYLEHIVKNMPELEGGNKAYFDTFYRQPLEQLKDEE